MAITRTTRKMPAAGTTPINASTSITSGVRNRQAPKKNITSSIKLTPAQMQFARQLQNNVRRQSSIMAATNTSNIAARPEFLELLPLFVQKLLILDVYGSVAMKSRQQLVPYFKFIAENTKGETMAGDILSSPFVNRQGIDRNFGGRVIKNELVAEGAVTEDIFAAYTPILPNSVTLNVTLSGTTTRVVDNGTGNLIDASTNAEVGYINYSNGQIVLNNAPAADEDTVKATYQYDNETVGPKASGLGKDAIGYDYGAMMGKGYLQLDEFNLVAEAHQLACYWSIYSAFAAQQEWGTNIGDIAKEAAFSELTAEINTQGFYELKKAAQFKPQFNWDASPVLSGSVVPSDYINLFKLKLNQASADIYQRTRLTQANRLVVGTNVATYIAMVEGFSGESTGDNVGPYKLGKLNQFDIFCDPNYDPNEWVMSCKSNDIRRNSALFGEYMPLTNTDAIGLANASVQQGYATMYAMKVVNPDTVVSGKIVGLF